MGGTGRQLDANVLALVSVLLNGISGFLSFVDFIHVSSIKDLFHRSDS